MKAKLLTSTIMVLLLVVGCSADNENIDEVDNDIPGEIKEQETTEQAADENETIQSEQHKELTMKVKAEDGVIDGQVYTQDHMAIGTLVLDSSVSDEVAQSLVEKYADELKTEYQDLKVNVQAVRDGKTVANITQE